jgi:hypothetical protein
VTSPSCVTSTRRSGNAAFLLLRHALHQRAEVDGVALQRDAAGQAGAREIEEIVDQAAHALAARQHPAGGFAHVVLRAGALDEMRAGENRAERIAQIVAEYGREHLVEPQRFRPLVQFAHELLLLAIELKEDVRLVAQDVRLDRLVEEIDRAALVALEHAVLIAHAGGQEDDRHMAGPLAAAHQLGQLEAVHVGHLHVEQRQRHVVRQQQIERLRAGTRQQRLDVVRAHQRRQREEVLLQVVDQQTLHAGLDGVRLHHTCIHRVT